MVLESVLVSFFYKWLTRVPCLFKLNADYIMWNSQAGIKIARRNINNLEYAADTNLTAESKEEQKSLLMKVREWKADLKLNIQKTKIMASSPITSWQIDVETMETVTDFIFLDSKITADGDCSTPGFPVLQCPQQFAQTHVHWVGDAIQPSHPLSPFLLPSVFPSIGVFSSDLAHHIRWPLLELHLQHQFFQWMLRTDVL